MARNGLYFRAGQSDISPAELWVLANAKFARVRRRVAENSMTPGAVLAFLSRDRDPDVRAAVGLNKNTPQHVLKRLILDLNVDLRYMLASSASLPEWALLLLKGDENPYVADRARRTIARIKQAYEILAE